MQGHVAVGLGHPDNRPVVAWATLGRRARAWRIVHAVWSVAQLACLAYIWRCAATGRRTPLLWSGIGFLALEGGALIVGGGDCPMGRRQTEWGDPVPFFELVLPPRDAKAAVPALTLLSVGGIAAVVLRRPGLAFRA
jgi:hypothetical protein